VKGANAQKQSHASVVARFAIALVLLGAVFYFVDLRSLIRAFSNLDALLIFYLVILSVVLIAVSCIKWQLFVRASGHEVGLTRLMSYYTMSYFFNMFLPSSLGGDVARGMQLGHYLGDHERALAATFIERLTGFLAMTLIGAIFVFSGAAQTKGLEIPILTLFFVTLIASLPAVSSKASRVFARIGDALLGLLPQHNSAPLKKLFHRVLGSLDFARSNPILLSRAIALSLLFHLLAVVNTYVCALGVGWDKASFAGLSVAVPLVLIVSAMPVTPSSIGVQEGAFVFFLHRVGASHPQALGIALILRAKNILVALVGGAIWVMHRKAVRLYSR
jgi:glycosyltransferase 2 family protein